MIYREYKLHKGYVVQVLVQQISCGLCGSRKGVGRGSNSCILGQHGGSHNRGILVSHSHNHSEALKALVQGRQMLVVLALDQLTSCRGGGCHSHNLGKESNSCILV